MPEDGIEQAVERTMADPYWNPRPIDRAAIRDLVMRAWSGEPPRSA
jgi:maleylacetate reductase